MGKSKPTAAEQKKFDADVRMSLSDRLQRMGGRLAGAQEGFVSFNKPEDLAGIVKAVQEMVVQARELEHRPDAETFITNAGAVQAANILYQARDDLDAVRRTLTDAQRALIEKHRAPVVDPDGALGGSIDAAISKLHEVRQLVASGSEARS